MDSNEPEVILEALRSFLATFKEDRLQRVIPSMISCGFALIEVSHGSSNFSLMRSRLWLQIFQ